MRIWLMFGMLFCGLFVQAKEVLLDKIERKMARDYFGGLQYAQKLKRQKIQQPDPYYILARHHFEVYQQEVTFERQVRAINRVPSDILRARKYQMGNDYIEPLLQDLTTEVLQVIKEVLDSLIALEQSDQAERLARQYYRLSGQKLPTVEQIKRLERQQKRKQDALVKARLQQPRFDGRLYKGMPNGDEQILDSFRSRVYTFVRILNAARKQKRLKPLVLREDLSRAARYHAYDMATERYFSHHTYDRIGGELVKVGGAFERMEKFYTATFINSENIAAGSPTAKETYHQWFTSKGHHANMFKKDANYIGVGVFYDSKSPYGYYWVMCTAR